MFCSPTYPDSELQRSPFLNISTVAIVPNFGFKSIDMLFPLNFCLKSPWISNVLEPSPLSNIMSRVQLSQWAMTLNVVCFEQANEKISKIKSKIFIVINLICKISVYANIDKKF